MKLLETYSRNCSVDIKHRPKIVEKFFPLPIDKYITLQNKSGMPAKDYDWFQEVIDLISPQLAESGIRIVLIGKEDPKNISPTYSNVIDVRNQTSLGQSVYLINRSVCHLGVDSWCAHLAAANGIPVVALYGSTTVKNHSPFHKNDHCHFLESDRAGKKASFAREENPKSVNLIKPEEIAQKIMIELGLNFNVQYKTLEINPSYNVRIVECIPDQVVDMGKMGASHSIVRMDFHFNEENLFRQLTQGTCTIVTDRPINLDLLQRARPNVRDIIYNIKDSPKPNPQFVKALLDTKFKYNLMTTLSKEEVNKYKLDFMDLGIINVRTTNVPKSFDIKNIDNLFYKSNRFLLSSQKIYQSLYDYKNKRPIPELKPTPQPIIEANLDYLWAESEHNYLLEKI